DEARLVLSDFGRMWNGIDPPWQPSAYEFLTDENTPGGLQPLTGMGSLIDHMAREAGGENLRYNTPVAQILSQKDHVLVQANDGTRFMGRVALFTGSLGVLKSGDVGFDPPLSADFRCHLSGMVMGRMNKIVVELDSAFFERRGIAPDTAFELLDAKPPHFCHVRSAGAPVIQLYVTGRQAEWVEGMTAREALEYLEKILSPVEMLAGFETHVVAEPVVSGWVSHPYTRGAYSCCLPGTKRRGPHREARVFLAGDTFDQRFPASVAGAWLSGQAAAGMIAAALDIHAGPAVWNETYQV
ncbi:MAG: flavin monoamine oxidase family protein, partial [Asticcacaulis sp.]